MLEEIWWFILWIVLLIGVHYQFKVCIPATICCLKIAESLVLLIMIKIYAFFAIYGDGFDLDMVKNATVSLYKQYAKMDL